VTQAPEKFVGGGLWRKEDPALVTGRANWTDNITLPGMLHAVFMRSPYAHAKITSIDVSAAKEQPGVVAVFRVQTSTTNTKSTLGKTLLQSPATI
jgi:carbon-monoxide dehydrogenase large subunit